MNLFSDIFNRPLPKRISNAAIATAMAAMTLCPAVTYAHDTEPDSIPPETETAPLSEPENPAGVSDDTMTEPYLDAEMLVRTPFEAYEAEGDTAATVVVAPGYDPEGHPVFNPDPTRAVWMSALFPGLGQVYNRRWWKLPIVVGGFLGLAYGTTWNNNQYQDYMQGYKDLVDNDPDTRSYMDFFPPNTEESSLDVTWLTSVMKSRKDFYRRNRDLCIICVVGLYLLCMLDAYVDAQMAHFDISPDLAMDVAPAVTLDPSRGRVALGLQWAFTF